MSIQLIRHMYSHAKDRSAEAKDHYSYIP